MEGFSIEVPGNAGEVERFELIPYALPFRKPYVTAPGTLNRRDMVLLRVHTSEGVVGLGEAVPLSLRGGPTLDRVLAELHQLGNDFAASNGAAQAKAGLSGKVAALSPPAACAWSTACIDLAGKSQGVPSWKVMSAQEARPVPCNATLAAGPPAEVANEALAWAKDGFVTFKLKLGTGRDLEQVQAVRAALGDRAKLRIDVNGAWSVTKAKRLLREMEAVGIEIVEQPVSTLAEMARVRPETSIPIAADESVSTSGDLERAIDLGACDMAAIKLSKVGAITAVQSLGALLPIYLSSALDGPVGIAAAAHVFQALRGSESVGSSPSFDPDLAQGLATQRLFAETIATRECELRDGFLHLPDGPGLGVEIDEAALERQRL